MSEMAEDPPADHETPMRWEKPGPGGWALDGAHYAGPVTRFVQDVYPAAMAAGFQSFTGRYGLVISHIDVRYVNDVPYGSVCVAGIAASDRPPPPPPLLKVLTRLHPEMRRRNRNALTALEDHPWRDDLDRWFSELRPTHLSTLRALQAVDPTTLDDDALADHLRDCAAQFADGVRTHFSLAGASGVPVGLYLRREVAAGRTPAEAIGDLGGAAAESTGATVPALVAIADALEAAGVDAPATLDDVRAASPAAAVALDAYLDDHGERVVGAFDVTGRRLVELPEVVLASVAASRGRAAGPIVSTSETVGDVDGVSEPVLSDDPVADAARLALRSRDDHSGICCMWSIGLARRALLAVGERAHRAGRVADPDHVLEASAAEAVALVRGGPSAPTALDLRERAARRARVGRSDPPAALGTLHPPPPPSVFPSGLRRLAEAMTAFLSTMDTAPPSTPGGSGVGVGTTVWRGRAVVALDPEDAIVRVRPGDVLVTPTTTPAFNCVLPIVGALVTAHGGLMSHAGIAARELHIPAVVGAPDVLERIPDGATVVVDPVRASVELAPPFVAFGAGARPPAVGKAEVGGKGAGLVTMSSLGLPVPPGVVLPTSLHRRFLAEGHSPALDDEVRAAVADLEERTGRRLGDPSRPLLVSVRSGAPVSMPGMMDTVLSVGATPETIAGLATEYGDADFADDTHRRFLGGWASTVDGLDAAEVDVAERASPTVGALADRLAELGSTPPNDPVEQVLGAVLAVLASWDGDRARAFRRHEGIDADLGTAVVIQQMVFGNAGPDSGTGVVFSRDPSIGAPGPVGDVLVRAQGDDVVDGRHRTATLAELAGTWPDVHRELCGVVTRLERHNADLVDVEFTVERGRLHLLQCRPGRRTNTAAVRIAVDMAEDPTFPLDRRQAVERCRHLLAGDGVVLDALDDDVAASHTIVEGLAASPGLGVGVLCTSLDDALRRHDAGEAVVLVRPHTSPADVAAMAVARGVVTATGGLVSHAALVARSWALPAVVGAEALVVTDDGVEVDGRRLAVGEVVTVDGTGGRLLAGAHTGSTSGVAELGLLRRWAAELDATGIAQGPTTAISQTVDPDLSVAEIDVVRVVVLRGRATPEDLVVCLVSDRATVEPARRRAITAGLVEGEEVVAPTAEGRRLVAADVAATAQRHGKSFTALLDRFEAPDRMLKALVTGAQSGPTTSEEVLERLAADVHPDAVLIIRAAADLVPRFRRYQHRLERALDALGGGDARFLAHPGLDSYHTVWFELHEELIGLAGTDRAAQAAAGRG